MKNFKIYYLVFGCFLFLIMSIGATYAYLVASVESTNSVVGTGSNSYRISMQIIPVPNYTGFSFIPMNDSDVLKAIRNECKDKYSRGACSAYRIRVFDYHDDLGYISGSMNFITDGIKNLSYMVLEESSVFEEDSCVHVDSKDYCVSHEVTSIGEGSNLSLGDHYDVSQVDEKNLLLVIWLSNLNENQNSTDMGSYAADVTIFAGSGGQIKGSIAGAIQVDSGDGDSSLGGNDNP